MTRRIISISALAVISAFLIGCRDAGTFGAARQFKVSINTNPSGRNVYVIDNEVWVGQETKLLASDDQALQSASFQHGRAPYEAWLPPRVFQIVGRNVIGKVVNEELNIRDDAKMTLDLTDPNAPLLPSR